MPLSDKQKNFVKENFKLLSEKQIAKRINVSVKDVKLYVREIKPPVPIWFYILLFIIPILFFVLLEISLRLFNYGNDNRVWIDISPEMQILNPEVSKRYFFTTKNAPFPVESFIYKEKKYQIIIDFL